MKKQDLKRLNRRDLLEMLVVYAEQIEDLKAELAAEQKKAADLQLIVENNDSLAEELADCRTQLDEVEAQYAEAQRKLQERRICIDESGSIAEASLKINQVFEAAQKAADQYLASIRYKHEQPAQAAPSGCEADGQHDE